MNAFEQQDWHMLSDNKGTFTVLFTIHSKYVQWNLSVTTTFMIKFITCDLFNEDWRYQLTLVNNFCLLELV